MSLSLLQCHPDSRRLAAWATRFNLTAGGDDLGYALHTLLAAAFGESAPKPFRYFGDARGLLGYVTHDAEALRIAAEVAPPDVYATLGLERFDIRRFPDSWAPGQKLAFEVRIRPVLRTQEGRERDVFQVAAERTSPNEFARSREEVYSEWLYREMARENAAQIETLQLDGFCLSASLRRKSTAEGKRTAHRVSGPDALFSGVLTVSDPFGFAKLLARGIGRHRAFGFGMLLLRPPSAC